MAVDVWKNGVVGNSVGVTGLAISTGALGVCCAGVLVNVAFLAAVFIVLLFCKWMLLPVACP